MSPRRSAFLMALCLASVAVAGTEFATAPADLATAPADGKGLPEAERQKLKEVEVAMPQPSEIMKSLQKVLTKQLHNYELQSVIAAIAFALGLVMILNGEVVFKYITVGFITLFFFSLASNIMSAQYGSFPVVVQYGFSLEVALILGAASYMGYEGIKLLIGGLIGSSCYGYVHDTLEQQGEDNVASKWYFFIGAINMFVLLGVVCFYSSKFHRKATALVSSTVGGAFLSSSICYFVMLVAVANRTKINAKMPAAHLTGEKIFWIDFLSLMPILVHKADRVDPGLFQNYDFEVSGTPICLDAWILRFFWLLFTVVGIMVQKRAEKTRGKKQNKQVAIEEPLLGPRGPPRSPRGGLLSWATA